MLLSQSHKHYLNLLSHATCVSNSPSPLVTSAITVTQYGITFLPSFSSSQLTPSFSLPSSNLSNMRHNMTQVPVTPWTNHFVIHLAPHLPSSVRHNMTQAPATPWTNHFVIHLAPHLPSNMRHNMTQAAATPWTNQWMVQFNSAPATTAILSATTANTASLLQHSNSALPQHLSAPVS